MPLVPIGEPSRTIADALRQGRGPLPQPVRVPAGSPVPGSAEWSSELGDAVRQRRSVRQFAGRPVAPAALSAAIEDGYRAESTLWPARLHGTVDFTVLTAAFAVQGLATGLHHQAVPFVPQSEGPLGNPPWLADLRAEYAPAPAILLICGDISAAGRDGGGYGTLLMRAASLGYAAWLSAVCAGLAGAVFGGAQRAVSAEASRLDHRFRHLFTLVLGYEHAADADAKGRPA
ncbi:nitroreductase family protein [Streptantibioticus rubrisoli]|uniref:Nitroreductase family protein n=1 Tax=Streptantibioticus rubrisoli TaxID=1387313 RepID=A0ABT1PBN0_9ACTN|nr:nitroreductase family protein [Streptantibioticus rubrisoli]MCQ4042784.1 nitroreductase family protein [Streptantibioticus rubrisoli]